MREQKCAQSTLPTYSTKLMERPSDFYRDLEKLRLRIGDLSYNILKLIEAYRREEAPFGETGEGLRVWARHRQWTTPN